MTVLSRLRTSFVTGLLLVAPLAVTAFVLDFVFDRLTGVILDPIVTTTRLRSYTGDELLLAQLLAATLLVVPLVRTVCFGVGQVSESLTRRRGGFDRVPFVEYPREGCTPSTPSPATAPPRRRERRASRTCSRCSSRTARIPRRGRSSWRPTTRCSNST